MEGLVIPFFILSLFSIFITSSKGVDTITTTKPLADGETIVSSGGIFELGFFSPGTSKNRYVGIWYKEIPDKTVVWVANRETPVFDTSGVLKLTSPGILVLVNGTNHTIWCTNTSRSAQDPVVQLFDSGNMVVRNPDDEIKEENFLWQSFDYPGNTLLPGMKIGKNLLTGQERYISSWKSDDDPGQGVFTVELDTHGYPQMFVRNGAIDLYASGPWTGLMFGRNQIPNPISRFNFDVTFIPNFNMKEGYYTYGVTNTSVVTRSVLSHEGHTTLWVWESQTRSWLALINAPKGGCDMFASCGSYGICKLNTTPTCGCLDKFWLKNPKDWDRLDWSSGCVRRMPLGCHEGVEDGFVKYSRVKLPDTRNSWFDIRMSLTDCRRTCLGNCSCMAYANLDVREAGSGCLLWFNDLIDIKELLEGDGQDIDVGQDIYVRIASSESGGYVNSTKKDRSKRWKWIILALAVSLTLLTTTIFYCIWRRKVQRKEKDLLSFDLGTSIGAGNSTPTEASKSQNSGNKDDLPRFSYASVSAATEKFSDSNKLGEGGFGPVYKGKLQSGYKVAVKRLSKKSGQGLEELQNEAMLIAKLQHKNLVRLLGCCLDREEKILIYEYMPNKSLDFFLFGPIKHDVLNWESRLKIIEGIAQGLLYLHHYSRLRIIHRDLKASNILLDEDMNPKISDFGMARIFRGNGSQATKRIVGTYGYMSPEYILEGLFSVKSDVFSFGVLLLEILSGKRNTGFYKSDSLSLLGHAWDLWRNGRGQDIKDPILEDVSSTNMLLRYINIGLLCVQESAADRPTMSDVVSMLSNETSLLPSPKQPGFSTSRSVPDQTSHKCPEIISENDMTIILIHQGKLQRGYKVAVKRLSRKFGQGSEELQNEAMLIAKLQHKNLVRLLGYYLDREEKILIYDYMPNKSLDFFLFGPTRHCVLNWESRLKIIEGIAQVLLYLHQYSRFLIIHRDLKASKILLDEDMNPKISDFGMARIFRGNGSQATKRIVGTYGYMSPEYILEVLFSVKSDVLSFGVLLLEILSGKRNTGFYKSDSLSLLGHAWDLWRNGRGQDIKDPILEDVSSTNMLLRYINIGMLCVQESAADRPTMSDVASMLSNETSLLPSPKQPGFSTSRSVPDQTSHKCPEIISENDMTMSVLEAR